VRKLRGPLLGVLIGAVLTLGGTALADIPDATPSSPDPSHILAFCYRDSTTPFKQAYLFDLSQGAAQSKPNCETALGTGWHTVYAEPAIPTP
jgi:hypothetical protein